MLSKISCRAMAPYLTPYRLIKTMKPMEKRTLWKCAALRDQSHTKYVLKLDNVNISFKLYSLLMNLVVLELCSLWKSRMKICFLYWTMDSLRGRERGSEQNNSWYSPHVNYTQSSPLEDRGGDCWLTSACALWYCSSGRNLGGHWPWRLWASGRLLAGQAV